MIRLTKKEKFIVALEENGDSDPKGQYGFMSIEQFMAHNPGISPPEPISIHDMIDEAAIDINSEHNSGTNKKIFLNDLELYNINIHEKHLFFIFTYGGQFIFIKEFKLKINSQKVKMFFCKYFLS